MRPRQSRLESQSTTAFDDRFYQWHQLADHPWPVLLLGNGASQAIWPRFGYHSLFEVARNQLEPGLSATNVELFRLFGSGSNFERVLGSLRTAQLVNSALEFEEDRTVEAYKSIRRSIVEAVKVVHIPYATVTKPVLRELRREIAAHDAVFTTNYDLLPYWAAMVDPPPGRPWARRIVDYLWTKPNFLFDASDTDVWSDSTRLYYLHGGLHLRRTVTSATTKVVAGDDVPLLDVIARDDGQAWLLFVSEGTAQAKLATIRSSDYLSFCLSELSTCSDPIVIFGHSLGVEDDHLVKALNRFPEREIAISLYRPEDQTAEMHRLKSRLARQDIRFFDAESHPLGDSGLSRELRA